MLKILLLPGYLVLSVFLHAQDSLTGPTLASSLTILNQPVHHESNLYNGVEHYGYNYKIKGFAYFQQAALQNGTLVYDGLTYTNVPMWYDLVKDQVIVQHFNKYSRIGLVSEKLDSFTIFNRHFLRLSPDSVNTGFYELLYDGKTKAFAKHTKIINRVIKQEVEEDFKEHTSYYIQTNNTWHSIKTAGSLVAIFGDRAKEVKQYLRKNNLKYKNDPVNTIVKAVAYYDSLNQ